MNAEATTLEPITLDWLTIDTVFLDMDGTLLDLHYDNHFWLEHMPQQFARHKQTSVEEARNTLHDLYKSMEGTLDWYSLDHWEEKLEMELVPLKHEVADRIAVRQHVEQFLQFLRDKGVRVVLLTNAHRKTVAIKFAYTPIEKYFDRVITSHDLGLAKEEDGFWNKLRAIEEYDPQHSLFIDDNLDVLLCAERHGVANLLAIHQPDSQMPPKHTKHFKAVECFTQLMHD